MAKHGGESEEREGYSTIAHYQEATGRYFLRETSGFLQGAEIGSQEDLRDYLLGDDTLPGHGLPQFASHVTAKGLEMVVGDAASELSRGKFASGVLGLTILKTLLLILSSERIGRGRVGDSSGVRALGFQDDRLKSRDRASSRGRYRRRWLDLAYVRLYRLKNS